MTPRRFSADVLRRGFAHAHHVEGDLNQTRLPLFVVTCPYTTFCPLCRSASLFADTASTFEELTKGNCGANQGWTNTSVTSRIDHQFVSMTFMSEPGWTNMSVTSRIDRQIVFFVLFANLSPWIVGPDRPVHRLSTFSGCLPLRKSTIRNRRVPFLQSRSLETGLTVANMCLVNTCPPLVCSCRFH